MAQQTAVSWLKDMLEWNYGDHQMLEISWENLDDLLERAKAMEKEQIRDAVIYGLDEDGHTGDWKLSVAEKYYNIKYTK